MIIVFLQNAWSGAYAGGEWPRKSWLPALRDSPTGKRLAALMRDVEYEPWNTTPIVGPTAKSVVPPDEDYIREQLATEPEVVVACGKQAEKVLCELWAGPLLVTPHPSYRMLTWKLLRAGNKLLRDGFTERQALRQRRGSILVEQLGSHDDG